MHAFDVLRAPGVEVARAGCGTSAPPTGRRQAGDTDKLPFAGPPSNAHDYPVKVAINETSLMISTWS